MSRRLACPLVALALSLAACTGGGKKEPPASNPGPGTGPGSGPTVTVTPAADAARAVTQVVDSTGGYLFALGADGTAYDLSFPANALLAPVSITMTPLSSLGGLPATGLLGAVKLEPEGLQLQEAATLTISPPAGTDRSKAVGIGYHGDGAGLHLTLLRPGTYSLDIPVMHFSGVGAASASAAEAAALAAQGTSSPADAYEQQLEAARAAAQARGLPLDDPGLVAQLKQIFAAWGTALVAPALQAAETSDALFDAAAQAFVRWDRQQALLGYPYHWGDPASPLWASFQRGLRNAYRQARTRCLAGDPTQVLALLRRGRQAALSGADIGYTPAETQDAARRCATFQLTFDSTARTDGSNGYYAVGHTRASFRIQLSADLLSLEGQGTLDYVSYDDVNSTRGERLEVVYTPGTIQVERGSLPLDLPDDRSAASATWLALAFPVTPAEDITYVSTRDGSRFHLGASFGGWWDDFLDANVDHRGLAASVWNVRYDGFTGPPGALHLERTASSTFTFSDATTQSWSTTDVLDLAHTPQP